MLTADKRRSRSRDKSLSSSSILTKANALKIPQPLTCAAFRPFERKSLLNAMPPPPLYFNGELVKSERSPHQMRRVSFSSKLECVYIAPRALAEKFASFYSQKEYKQIYVDNMDTIERMVNEKSFPSSDNQYYRGLLTPRACYEREQRIKFVVSKILKQQESGLLNEKWLQVFSEKFSSQTTIAALYLGKVDAKAAGVLNTPQVSPRSVQWFGASKTSSSRRRSYFYASNDVSRRTRSV